MIIDVLVCNPDGTQVLEQRELPDDWFAAAEEPKDRVTADGSEAEKAAMVPASE